MYELHWFSMFMLAVDLRSEELFFDEVMKGFID